MKKVLYINISKNQFETKSLPELKKYIGGVGVGLKLLQENEEQDPIVFSIGPLNGFFPFASKTSVVFKTEDTLNELYLGGTLSNRIRFAGLDAIIIVGKSKEPVILDIFDENVNFRSIENDPDALGLPGKKSVIRPVMDKFLLDRYFATYGKSFEEKLAKLNIRGIVVTGTKSYGIEDKERYTDLYKRILAKTNDITVAKNEYPSCSGCPVGCEEARIGEIDGDEIVHSLVACKYAEEIYSNIGIVFSCLNILGYDYTHEDIEVLPELVRGLVRELS